MVKSGTKQRNRNNLLTFLNQANLIFRQFLIRQFSRKKLL